MNGDDDIQHNFARRIEQNLGVLLLLLLLVGAFLVLQPFLSALMWAFVMAFSLWHMRQRLVARFNGRRTMAAFALSISITMVLVVPTIVLVANLTDDARNLARATKAWAMSPPAPPGWVEKIPIAGGEIKATWQSLTDDLPRLVDREHAAPTTQPLRYTRLGQMLSAAIEWSRYWVPIIGYAVGQGVVQFILSVFFTFFLFRDGEALAQRLKVAAIRLAGERGERLVTIAGGTVRGVVYGILGTAIVQGLVAYIGFAIAGVPGAVLLGFLTFLLSPVPIGPPLVWVPAMLWLFHEGQTGWAIFMGIWGFAVVSMIDNILKPLIISKGSDTPFILILCGVIGGAMVFGFIGVFLGPTLLAVTYRLIADWSQAQTPEEEAVETIA